MSRLDHVRNIGIMAHIDAGKTTVSERILYYSGRTHRIAEVHDGEATMDFMEQERERGITISSSVSEIEWRGSSIFLIDTPGHVDFTVEVERSLRVLDGVIALFDAVSGVEAQSETVWFQADRHQVPRIVFINKMDRPGADFDHCVGSIREILGGNAVEIQRPIYHEGQFVGVVDLVRMRSLLFNEADQGLSIEDSEVGADLLDDAMMYREHLVESLADIDDEIAELYLSGDEVSEELMKRALRFGTIHRLVVPVLCGSGLRNKGVQPLMDAVIDYLPCPSDLPSVVGVDLRGNEVKRKRSNDESFCALVFKTQQIEGKKLLFLRIYSGMLSEGDTVMNASSREQFKVKHIYRMYANRVERISRAYSGELVSIMKVRATMTGDSLCNPQAGILLERIDTKAPVISIRIEAENLKDKEKLELALSQLSDEDPTLVYEEDSETGELLLRGMGELHLEIVCERLKREFGVVVRKGHPTVVCKESVIGVQEAVGEFLREHDGEEIYGEVRVSVEGLERGKGGEVLLSSGLQSSGLRQEVLDAAIVGARDAMHYGPSGFEMTDVRVKIEGIGSDSKGNVDILGTRIAAGNAVRRAFESMKVVILEPLMEVDIVAGEEEIGDLVSDLSARKGVVGRIESLELRSVIHALVPLREMFGYTMKLRMLTHGRGSFSMRFKSFDVIS